MLACIAFGALVALGAFSVHHKARQAESHERIARHRVERAKHEAAKAVAELEALKLTNPPPKRGRPRKEPETEVKP